MFKTPSSPANLKRKRSFLRSSFLAFQLSVLAAGSFFCTAFVFLNGFELISNRNLAYANALDSVDLSAFLAVNQQPAVAADSSLAIGGFGEPQYLKIGSQAQRFPLVPGITDKSDFLARASGGHYLYLAPAKNGNLGTTLIYLRQGWRTINDPALLRRGDNIFLDTNKEWRYMYRVSEITTVPTDFRFVVPDSEKAHLVVIITDKNQGAHTVVVADFINLQNSQR